MMIQIISVEIKKFTVTMKSSSFSPDTSKEIEATSFTANFIV